MTQTMDERIEDIRKTLSSEEYFDDDGMQPLITRILKSPQATEMQKRMLCALCCDVIFGQLEQLIPKLTEEKTPDIWTTVTLLDVVLTEHGMPFLPEKAYEDFENLTLNFYAMISTRQVDYTNRNLQECLLKTFDKVFQTWDQYRAAHPVPPPRKDEELDIGVRTGKRIVLDFNDAGQNDPKPAAPPSPASNSAPSP